MDGTAMDVLKENVGWESVTIARRYVGMKAAAAAARVMRCRETAFLAADGLPLSEEADGLPLSEQFARSCAAIPRDSRSRTFLRST